MTKVYDFSVNTNLLGIPDNVIKYVSEGLEKCASYPDPECSRLRQLLAEKYMLPQSFFLCGNGADDLFYRLVFAMRPSKALIVEPTFEEYEKALRLVGCSVEHFCLTEECGFEFQNNLLETISKDLDLVIICNPNNPTGTVCEIELLKEILNKCQRFDIKVAVDECFMEFLPDWKKHSAKFLTRLYDNLIVIDAFTKTYSLAGFRLGFCVSYNQKFLNSIAGFGQSYGVSVPAQLAGESSILNKDYILASHSIITVERSFLEKELSAMQVKVYSSKTNFILFYCDDERLALKLEEKNIILRDCSGFYSLNSLYHRIAVSAHDKNMYLVKTLNEIL
ncbi:threonine-phosphate decarboxylase [Clostridiales bacterium]|nr:threonine-phosphate decarboxylase [Clostridiales bacterium]